MAAGQHNPSRRALLGAAVSLPLVATTGPLLRVSPGSPPRPGEEWEAALAAYERAAAHVREVEAGTAGLSFAEEEARLPAHDAACAAMEGALERVLRVPAPGPGALAVKIELMFGQAVEPGAADEGCVAALLADARRLLAG